jgi:hypothetical protein
MPRNLRLSIPPEDHGTSTFFLGQWLSIPLHFSSIGALMVQVGACIVLIVYNFETESEVYILVANENGDYMASYANYQPCRSLACRVRASVYL